MNDEKKAPVFIALEGGDGAGKSTQAQMLVARLRREGRQATLVHEPGTTTLGDHLRAYLKSDRRICPQAELLLFEAARAQLVEEIIRPSLEKGTSVVADRFAASSIAYQGYGRRIGKRAVRQANDFATGGLYPHINLLLDTDPATGLARTKGPQMRMEDSRQEELRQDPDDTRRFEELPGDFHRRVREGYLAQVAADPEHWRVIDGTMRAKQVHEAIWERVVEVMGRRDA